MTNFIGQTVSHYKILEKLGEGGMGVVYKAEDTKLKRTVALKFLPRGLETHEPERARFLQEAQAAATINHPNICTVYDIQEHEGQQFIVMEYVEGKTLREIVPVKKLQDAVGYAIQIAEALHEAHTHGIVHRDIKAENIMVNTKNQVKVMDFGLAKLKGSLRLTKTSSTVGTVSYMAPEQIQGGEVDTRSDIFSFGVVLYEMLTGHMPFHGEHEAAIMYSILNEEPESLQIYLPEAPSELLHIMDRALEKNAEERYQSINEMLIDLRRCRKQTSPVPHAIPTRPYGESPGGTLEHPSKSDRSHDRGLRTLPRWVKTSAAALTVLILCISGWVLFHPGPKSAALRAGHSSQLTSDPGIEIDPALSPDGKMIAYVAYLNGSLRVHVKQVTGGRTICPADEIAGDQRSPRWSADGSEVYFSIEQTKLSYAVPALGGAPRRMGSGVWAPDGSLTASSGRDTVYVSNVDGSNQRRLGVVYEPHSLAWSPDGSLVALVSGNDAYLKSEFFGNIAPSAIYVIAVSTGALYQVTDRSSLNMSPTWSGDGRRLFFVSNCDGTRDVYSIAIGRSGRPEGIRERLTTGLNAHTISLSSDAKMLAYSVLSSSANIWSVRIPETGTISVREATQVTTGNQMIEGLSISHDGQWLAYDSNREGNQNIFKLLLKGEEPVRLTREPSDDFLPSWSPDGKLIAFYSFRTGNRDLFVMLSDGSQQQQVTHDPAQERYPDWSPDGSGLVFYSDKTGRQQIYTVRKKAGSSDWEAPQQITFDGGETPRWSPDGHWIAYIRGGLCIISPEGGTPRVLVSGDNPSTTPAPLHPAWSPDSRIIFYKAVDDSRRSSFWAVPLDGGKPRLLVRFDEPTRQSIRPEFATDGKQLFFTLSRFESDIWKMELVRQE